MVWFVPDGAPCMCKAGRALRLIYPRMIHIICVDHGLHNLSETIRDNYPQVDLLISKTKKVFLKSPKRIERFRSQCPGISLPPKPVITRWGTWVKAAMYYADHFEAVKGVIDSLDANEAKSISKCQELFGVPVYSYFFFLF
jgi:hypothetical protein